VLVREKLGGHELKVSWVKIRKLGNYLGELDAPEDNLKDSGGK